MSQEVSHAWCDDVPYSGTEQQPFAMQVEAAPRFQHPCGFIRLRERHRVKATRSTVNSQDRHCRIRRVKLK
jgi:hypothetical protein